MAGPDGQNLVLFDGVELNLNTPEGPYGPTEAMVDNRRRVNEASEENNRYVVPDKTKTY